MAYEALQHLFDEMLQSVRDDGLYRNERIVTSPQGPIISVSFGRDDPPRELINLSSNDYLGLCNHPEIVRAAHEGLDRYGYGLASVRLISGTRDNHRLLERKIADFLGMEDALLFNSCFDANGALFESILTPRDAVFSDRNDHASTVDGIRLCRAQRNIYQHCNMSDLEEALSISKARIKMIMTDGVFSMDGNLAPLDRICRIAEQHNALVAVDDSHATGVVGKTGRGTHEYFDVMDKVDIITTTFGKALGGANGACIAGRKEIIELLRQNARSYSFSNALMPAITSATIRVLELLSSDTERRDRLETLTKFWRHSLAQAGFDVRPGNTPIVPVMFTNAQLTMEFSRRLFEEGVFAVGFADPAVPSNKPRIRTQISASHEENDLKRALEAFVKVKRELAADF